MNFRFNEKILITQKSRYENTHTQISTCKKTYFSPVLEKFASQNNIMTEKQSAIHVEF